MRGQRVGIVKRKRGERRSCPERGGERGGPGTPSMNAAKKKDKRP